MASTKLRPYLTRPELDYLISIMESTRPPVDSPDFMKHITLLNNLLKLQFTDQTRFTPLSTSPAPIKIPSLSQEEINKGLSDLSSQLFGAQESS